MKLTRRKLTSKQKDAILISFVDCGPYYDLGPYYDGPSVCEHCGVTCTLTGSIPAQLDEAGQVVKWGSTGTWRTEHDVNCAWRMAAEYVYGLEWYERRPEYK